MMTIYEMVTKRNLLSRIHELINEKLRKRNINKQSANSTTRTWSHQKSISGEVPEAED